jgi:uncharacterized membrane-anchored protein
MPRRAIELLSGRNHPQRQALTEEMHVRQFPAFAAPARLLQLVVLSIEPQADAARRHAVDLCRLLGAPWPGPEPGKYLAVRLPALDFYWEQHSEFTTYSFIKRGAFADPFAVPLLTELPLEWLAALPGQILRATQVALLSRDAPEPAPSELQSWFRADELVCCEVLQGEARIWSNFRVHEDGLGRLLIRDQALVGAGDPSRLVQCLQELGNYRNMALLGLPVAQRLTPALTRLEQRLAALSREISSAALRDEELMHQVSHLSAELASLTADTSYRMSASRAYAQIVSDRLRDLQVGRVPGFQTLVDFTERRLVPAMRTCESFWKRSEELSERAAWASSLLRMRIETALERQNGDLLASMNRRAHLQLRLQQTVEGLSVIAISYYAVGILGYLAKAVSHYVPGIDANVATGLCAPLVVLGTWMLMRRLRRRLEAGAPPETPHP